MGQNCCECDVVLKQRHKNKADKRKNNKNNIPLRQWKPINLMRWIYLAPLSQLSAFYQLAPEFTS